MEKRVLLMAISAFVVFLLCGAAHANPGIATFYTTYTPSACYGNQPEGVMIAAASDSLWDNGKICGQMFTVKCTGPRNPVPHPCNGNSVTVKIVDHCPSCPSTLDLSREAFAAIADPVAGIINIDYAPA
ncbi:PREDICTED: putative EG45-like domain containing protein 1 [Tarenaya hassleriana]|uniref:putative EG45-like domain containing protein 1 n=1 Tax=Tarenaya hassleriana TaxID=28532 RepID=UPI00053C2261|nr:PREDICTED: putative EG45-like domain containing protein 1 [Tarenaya hassleriana]